MLESRIIIPGLPAKVSHLTKHGDFDTELRNVIVTTWEENIWEKLWTDWVLCYLVRRWWTGDMEHVTNKRHCASLEAIANINFSQFILMAFRGSFKFYIFYVISFKSYIYVLCIFIISEVNVVKISSSHHSSLQPPHHTAGPPRFLPEQRRRWEQWWPPPPLPLQ